MFELMKIVGLSAVLSAGFVTASEMQAGPGAETTGGKIYTDRVPEGQPGPVHLVRVTYMPDGLEERQRSGTSAAKGDSLRTAPRACASQAWPNIDRDCLVAADGTPVRTNVRTITVEQRDGANTSVLIRMPAEVAQR